VPLTYLTDHDPTSLGLPRIGSGLRLTEIGPSVYSFDNDEGHQATIRFEEIGSGLRVMDVDDGDRELAVLDGISMGFIERWAAGEPGLEFRVRAIIDEDGDITADFPDPLVQESTGTAFLVDASGFVAVDVADGLIHVRRSTDGLEWIETDIVGDDPGEPTGIRGIGNAGQWLVSDSDRWVSVDGVTWLARPAMGEEVHDIPIGSGWLRWSSRDPDSVQDGIIRTIAYQPEGSDPIPFDVSDVGITAPTGFGGTSLNAVSSNTVVWTHELDGEGRGKEIWIVTFDDLPA
jgi:hypothetical protein